MGDENFDAAIASGALRALQPDRSKWGGTSGTFPVARQAGAAGLLRISTYHNLLRITLCGLLEAIADGRTVLGAAPALGGDPPDMDMLEPFRVPH